MLIVLGRRPLGRAAPRRRLEQRLEALPPGRGLIFVHGGGWVAGTLDGYDHLCLRLSREAQATVVSVDYRLAPEHPFPAALEDCCAAVLWVQGNRDELGISTGQLTIAGSSAGGNLALATSLKLRDAGTPAASRQILIYPLVRARAAGSGYAVPPGPAEKVTGELLAWYWRRYLTKDADYDDPLAAPLNATGLAGLPTALVLLAGRDPLLAEGLELGERLSRLDPGTQVRTYRDQPHGFVTSSPGCGDTSDAYDRIREFVTSQA